MIDTSEKPKIKYPEQALAEVLDNAKPGDHFLLRDLSARFDIEVNKLRRQIIKLHALGKVASELIKGPGHKGNNLQITVLDSNAPFQKPGAYNEVLHPRDIESEILQEIGDGVWFSNDIALSIGISQNATNNYLKKLVAAGKIIKTNRRNNVWATYKLVK